MTERTFMQNKGRTSKPQIWRTWREGSVVHTEWGPRGGILQKTEEEFPALDVGKSNERSAEQVAQEKMDKRIEDKVDEGYREVDKRWKFIDGESANTMDFRCPPKNLRYYKPPHQLSAELKKLVKKGGAWFTRKRDGMMFSVSVDEAGTPRMYASRNSPTHEKEPAIPWLDRFPELQEAFEAMNLHPKTILVGEVVADAEVDDLQYVSTIIQSLTPRALDLQIEHQPLTYCLWDVIFMGGVQLAGNVPFDHRRETMERLVYTPDGKLRHPRVIVPELETFSSTVDAENFAKEKDWEGWVVVDPSATYGDRAITWHGKNERPKECGKLKPEYEADCILIFDPDKGIGEWGKGKKTGGVGSFGAFLMDENEGLTFVGKAGGLTDEQVRLYAKPGIHIVGQVKFTALTRDGKMQFPSFVRERDDKTEEECTLDQLLGVRRIG